MRLRSIDTLRALLKQEGLSIGGLAQEAQCSKGFISHLLAGRRSSCTPALGVRIARALGVPVTVLFELNRPFVQRRRDQTPSLAAQPRTVADRPRGQPPTGDVD
ncbi:helix-turn-helix transcriptional regulator [Arthrobacter russicus]|uniref:helix-turn-helix transcriptional regulator n=1 Tax=Arthrobacter russicus TaxID=172040 RepID=UPI00337CCBB1